MKNIVALAVIKSYQKQKSFSKKSPTKVKFPYKKYKCDFTKTGTKSVTKSGTKSVTKSGTRIIEIENVLS